MYKGTFQTVTIMIFKISHLMPAPWDDIVDKRERKWVSSKEHAWWKESNNSITLSSGFHMHCSMSTLFFCLHLHTKYINKHITFIVNGNAALGFWVESADPLSTSSLFELLWECYNWNKKLRRKTGYALFPKTC